MSQKKVQKLFLFGLCLTLSFALICKSGFAQTGRGTIQGVVRDASKAVVPGAQVVLTNTGTNVSQTGHTNEVGLYYFGALQPGPYTLNVEVTGFKKWEGKLELQVGQNAVVDVSLELGSAEATVEVVGAAPVITTESTEVADIKDSQRIRQLPLNGRLISNLFLLTPGVEGEFANNRENGNNVRVNGLKVGAAEITVDGISIVDRFGGGIARVQPGLDTVQEFRIETVGSNAQNSRPASITVLTKSGTNEFHGSVFETLRNNGWGLRTRARNDGDTAAKLQRNEFGVSAGGPVFIPKVYDGRNKTFWFAAYEGLRQRQASLARFEYNVPTAAMWNGDFSGLVDPDGNQTKIYDPLTTDANGVRQQFPNNIIPSNRISNFYKTVQSITDDPAQSISPWLGPNHIRYYPNNLNQDTFTIKGDHKFTDKDSLSARFTRSTRPSAIYGGVYGSPKDGVPDAYGSSSQDYKIYNAQAQYTHIFSPTFLNELLLSGHYSPAHYGTLADFTDWATKLGFPNPFGATGWPTFYSDENSYNGYFGWDADNLHDQHLTTFNFEDNVTLIKGKHSMKFGAKFRPEYNNVRELQQAQGSHTFGRDWTALYDPTGDKRTSFTGSGLAAMALGLPTYLSNQYNRGYFYFQQKELGLYFNDNWKVTPRLTLDLGLRWDRWTPYHEKYDRLVNVDLDTINSLFQVITPHNTTMESIPGIPPSVLASWTARGLSWTTADSLGFPGALFQADNNNFGPRVGAAFKLTDKTVLRGSYGEFFWPMPLSQILQSSRSNPPLNLRFENQLGTNYATGSTTRAQRVVPTPQDYIGTATVPTEGIVTISPAAQYLVPLDARSWQDDRSQSWHFTLEREVMKNTALRLSYVGDHGRNLEQRFSVNAQEPEYNYVVRTGQSPPENRDLLRVNPQWSPLATNHTGYSNTHSFQAEMERRYYNGLAFQVFYSFTRSLTTTDAGGFTSGAYFGAYNAGNGVGEVPENSALLGEPNLSYDDRLRLLYYNSTNVPAHRVRWNGIYDLPFGRGKHFGGNISKGWDYLVGGWQLAALGDWRGGLWSSINPALFMTADPSLSPDQRLEMNINGRTQRLWFRGYFDPTTATNVTGGGGNLEALVPADPSQRIAKPLGPNFDNLIPVTLADGTTFDADISTVVNPNAKAFYKGPAFFNSDISIYKNFAITESMRVRFSADFFNVFNHPNDLAPDTRTGLQDLSRQLNDPRIIQFSLRFDW